MIGHECFCVHFDSLVTIGDRHWQKLAPLCSKAESTNIHALPFVQLQVPFMWGDYFCMGTFKHDVVVVIKIGVYVLASNHVHDTDIHEVKQCY